MKYVYVLTSSEKDFYYEQFLLSAASLRLNSPKAEIIALIDEKTKKGLTGKRAEYENYVSETKVIHIPNEFSQQKDASRWIKTSIHHYVSGDFLFIDCDTIITENLKFAISNDIHIGAVLDTHVTLDKHHLRNNFILEDKKAGFVSSLKTNTRYNGGLIFCKGDQPAHDFFDKWHELWLKGRKKGCSQDMPSLTQANYEKGNIITELAGEWNCQISYNMLPFLHNAKIIHYFAATLFSQTSPFILASDQVFNEIRASGNISFEVLELLKNPKTAFDSESRVIAGKEILDVINSNLFAKLFWLRKKMPGFFNRLNKLGSLIKK